ncbi:ATP-binding protein [Geobacter sp. DSM 9736]|uniref:sensor histidine kinase n=1 Tax=Geobacter sp. DSM 9736 TaxID=1277350 RepID=UPI000B502173|nr:ATP-binding protein [Geobacter sp. DSM 9736]SNB47271.1 hypothetical protein SAMN06269301_2749 [Geobacter sp. DSM 9736]
MSRTTAAPLKITLIFLIAGCAWILLSDLILSTLVRDPALVVRLSIYKGWLFMVVTAAYLYWLVYRYMAAILRSEQRLMQLNSELEQRVAERTAELGEANQELEAIFRALPDVFIKLDRNGRILDYQHPGCSQNTSVKPEAIGDILPGSALLLFREAVAALPASGEPVSFEYMVQGAEEGEHYEIRLLPYQHHQLIAFIRNITDRKRAEQEIHDLNEDLQRRACELEVANEELESFGYSVSHDLRAPLRHIDGYSKALQEDCSDLLPVDGKMFIQRVRHAVVRMNQLIDDMLKLANVTSCGITRQPVNLSGMARTIMNELQQAQPERKVVSSIGDGITAYGDPRLLRVVMTNLLGNAWKYTGNKDAAEIEFGCLNSDQGPTYFVRDNGAGFDMNYAGKLFNPFQRLHGPEEFEGSGIGLATVQRVIRRHGGKVWGEGITGQGATFFFTIGGNAAGEQGDE